jgi:predicted Zn-dependent protease
LPVVVSEEAVIDLCRLLNQVAFSAVSYYDGSSFLRQHLGVQVFDRELGLRDDGTDPAGLPFPFDLEGTAKRPFDLILKGIPKTPALDQRQAARLGLPPTASAIAGNDARALNLFLQPGERSLEELLAAADGGVWLGWLHHLESHEPQRVQFRARAGGVRRIRDGRLAEALPDLIWEDSLLRAFSTLLGIGQEPALRANPDGYLGATSAPALTIGEVEGLRPADRRA